MNFKLFSQGTDGAIYKVCALFTHQNAWAPKSSDDLFKQEVSSYEGKIHYHHEGIPGSSYMRWYILVAKYLCSSTG
jgi:hypothetical protein